MALHIRVNIVHVGGQYYALHDFYRQRELKNLLFAVEGDVESQEDLERLRREAKEEALRRGISRVINLE